MRRTDTQTSFEGRHGWHVPDRGAAPRDPRRRNDGVRGRIQCEGEVVHLVARHLVDLSSELASVGDRDVAFPLPHGRGDEFHHGNPRLDPRSLPKGPKPRDICDPYGHIDQIKVKTRDFR